MDMRTAAEQIARTSNGQLTIAFTSPTLARRYLVRVLSRVQARKTVAAYLATDEWTGAKVYGPDGDQLDIAEEN